ncbi:MAG: hypothetical protein H7A53_12715 [Akkermansiaceae bacterium]|nr:hypothetical protein [Akkermansiaceae bacterium]MCP5551743.1 hypothetical protein [Akkermansiaceae bacterium]
MSDEEIHQPNDKLFSATFGVPANAAALLRAELPPSVASVIEWEGLQTVPARLSIRGIAVRTRICCFPRRSPVALA